MLDPIRHLRLSALCLVLSTLAACDSDKNRGNEGGGGSAGSAGHPSATTAGGAGAAGASGSASEGVAGNGVGTSGAANGGQSGSVETPNGGRAGSAGSPDGGSSGSDTGGASGGANTAGTGGDTGVSTGGQNPGGAGGGAGGSAGGGSSGATAAGSDGVGHAGAAGNATGAAGEVNLGGGAGSAGAAGAPEVVPEATVVINEFVASNRTGITDPSGGAGDWIELYNPGALDVDLGGYFVSDAPAEPEKAELASGLVIRAGGMLLLWADSDIDQGDDHLPFNLAKSGESVVLTSPSGELLDTISYENAETDRSMARVPDGTGDFVNCANPTPRAPNDPSCAD